MSSFLIMKFRFLNLTLLALLLGGLLLLTKQTFAAVRCETQYGGGEVCVKTGELQINKKVWNPKAASYWNEITVNGDVNEYHFSPGEEIIFQLKITNVGDETYSKVWVVDTLPEFMEYVSGDLNFTITDLVPDETEERTIKARIKDSSKLPANIQVLCDTRTTNSAIVDKDENHDEYDDRDISLVCVEQKVLGVTPVTGPENGLLALSLSLIAGLTGLSFLKISQKISAR